MLSNLSSTNTKRKRVGRGGSRGGTSGRGHKGQRARSGGRKALKPYFEGGQMPLTRRLPRRGFNNSFAIECKIIGLDLLEAKFEAGESVNRESLVAKKMIKGRGKYRIKILGNGKITKSLTVLADACSKSAHEAIINAGGTVELVTEERGRDSTAA